MFSPLLFVRDAVVRPLRFARRHRTAIFLLSSVLWFGILGLSRADFRSTAATPSGIAQAALAGEKSVLSDLGWAAIDEADRLIVFAIDLTSRVAAEFTARFLLYLRAALEAQASAPCQ